MQTLKLAINHFVSRIINMMYFKVFSFAATSNNGVLYCGGDACGTEEDCDCGEKNCDCEEEDYDCGKEDSECE